MSELSTSFILGYHGCDTSTAETLLSGHPFRLSRNSYDWLGFGIYFWEANPARGLAWARELKERGKIQNPAVVGAVIDPGNCLDLVSEAGIEVVKTSFVSLKKQLTALGLPIPSNHGGDDLLQRKLDCAVINHLHKSVRVKGRRPYDTVRGVFLEGRRIYETSGFFERTHIQICVRNPENIKGVFRVPDSHLTEL